VRFRARQCSRAARNPTALLAALRCSSGVRIKSQLLLGLTCSAHSGAASTSCASARQCRRCGRRRPARMFRSVGLGYAEVVFTRIGRIGNPSLACISRSSLLQLGHSLEPSCVPLIFLEACFKSGLARCRAPGSSTGIVPGFERLQPPSHSIACVRFSGLYVLNFPQGDP